MPRNTEEEPSNATLRQAKTRKKHKDAQSPAKTHKDQQRPTKTRKGVQILANTITAKMES